MKKTLYFEPTSLLLAFLILSAPLLSGCAAALLAGGAVGGYALAKNMENGKQADAPKKQENKGWFGGNGN